MLTCFSCNKKGQKSYKYRCIGYIFNKNDSTPFSNTNFKLYKYTGDNGISQAKTEETFFTTDATGHFDFTAEHAGSLVWPSYIHGAAYIGPPYFGNGKREQTDEPNKIIITYFDTLYTTPYH